MKESLRTKLLWLADLELELLSSKLLIILLGIGNFLGALIGFIYYYEIIGLTRLYHPAFWILVPDCPMAALLLVGFYLQGDKQKYGNYNFLAFIQSIRGAFITYLLVFNFPSIDIEIVMIGHTLLILQALAIIPLFSRMKINKFTLIVVLITIFNDITDFFGFLQYSNPTLAQYNTLKPMFSTFIILIYGLDIILISLGIILAKFLD